MNVTYFNRPKMKGAFSEETVFGIIKKELTDKIRIRDYNCSSRWHRMYSLLNANKYHGDVNHITGDVFHLAIVLRSNKTVVTVHDIGHYVKTLKGLKKVVWKQLMYKIPFQNCKFITTISEFTKDQLIKQLGVPEEKIKVIHNPAPTDFDYHKKKFKTECPTVLQIGSGEHKNLRRLIEAVSGIDFKLLLIRRKDKSIQDALNEKGINYEWHENITREEVYNCYKRCDIVFFASEYEGFGVPILEANAVGRPVITSNVASMPEVAADSAVIINPVSVQEIRQALLSLANNPELRSDLIKKGRRNLERFSPAKIAAQYLELYRLIAIN